jgi:hypothetical protein
MKKIMKGIIFLGYTVPIYKCSAEIRETCANHPCEQRILSKRPLRKSSN